MQYGREMWEKQNQAENERMALQNQWNKDAAAQSQQYAKEMLLIQVVATLVKRSVESQFFA